MDELQSYIDMGIANVSQCTIGAHTFSTLPELPNGLSLLSHIRQHMRGGLGLRQIIDWMLYVKHSLNDSVWHGSFQPAARECGLEKLAITVTRMCQMYLGLSESITWCSSADETICSELMDYIFVSGNFGRKVEGYMRSAQHTMMQKNYLWKTLVSLQSKGSDKLIIKEHPFLRPFAWAVQISHYVRQMVRRGNVVKAFSEDSKKARQLRDILDALEIKPE